MSRYGARNELDQPQERPLDEVQLAQPGDDDLRWEYQATWYGVSMTTSKGSPKMSDRIKVAVLTGMRRSHRRTLESSSADTFRRRVVATSPAPQLVAAARRYKKMGWLPADLITPDKVPKDARLPLRYSIPYYATSKIVWRLYGKSPINPKLQWDRTSRWNKSFPPPLTEWGSPTADDSFVRLRLQGPNPFVLCRAEPDQSKGDEDDWIVFDLDFSRLFDGVFVPTIARFRLLESGLVPAWISIDGEMHRPGARKWAEAKRIVNGLDARYSAFIRHLLNTHLMVGQAYALAAYTLPAWHPLRPFMDFFTYGTLHVNHIAFGSLLAGDSYFLRSNFISADDAHRLIINATAEFNFDEWLAPADIKNRGIDVIPNHPYVEDCKLVWPLIERIVNDHMADIDLTQDQDVTDDEHLVAWYATLRSVLPGVESVPALTGVADLRNLMTALIYNNVIHEICGDFSPILGSQDSADKAIINMNHMRLLAETANQVDQVSQPAPLAADVFLMDQATFVSKFNVLGNNLMTIRTPRFADDPRLCRVVAELQRSLLELDQKLSRINANREVPFRAMQPHKWEASISF